MITGVLAVVAVLLVGTAFGLWRRRVDGRLREEHQAGDIAHDETLTRDQIGVELGATATLVQFSSAFCQPCRATRTLLTEVSEMLPGVISVDIDAENHLDLVRQLHIMRTPTVLVLDATGLIRTRASGLPRKADVIAAIGALG
ncbi:unannotated protein [freshwater metagenome]|uniref:Unannotated protein n=1 Tax=freshwater metagenome TaxID=449393 RepID=A0A6J7H673_9ZZZZ